METYKTYWKNIEPPIANLLRNMQNNDSTYNMRAMMFYVSQFYSIVKTINNLYDNITNTKAFESNIAVFNSPTEIELNEYGIPVIPEELLNEFKFEYKGASDEDKKREYFKQYAPMQFIFMTTYYKS